MPHLSALHSLLNRNAIVQLDEEYGKKMIILEEPQNQISKVTIRNVPEDIIVIDLDSNFSNSKVFQSGDGYCKRSDYILISQEVKKVLFIEMKSMMVEEFRPQA